MTTVSLQRPAQVKRRGRKLGVKTVSASLEQHRRAWLNSVTQEKGQNYKLCQLLGAPDSFVSHLLASRRTFTDGITRRIEEVLHLPPGTIDAAPVQPVAPVVPATSADTPPPQDSPAAEPLDPELETALRSLFNRAISKGTLNNASAARLIQELVSVTGT